METRMITVSNTECRLIRTFMNWPPKEGVSEAYSGAAQRNISRHLTELPEGAPSFKKLADSTAECEWPCDVKDFSSTGGKLAFARWTGMMANGTLAGKLGHAVM